MIIDKRTDFGKAVSVVGAANTKQVVGDVIDLEKAGINQSGGATLWLVVLVATSIVAADGAANVTFALQSDSAAGLNAAPKTHWSSGAIPKATLVAGYSIIAVPLPSDTYGRYLGVTATPDTNPITAGAVTAFLTPDASRWTSLPQAVN